MTPYTGVALCLLAATALFAQNTGRVERIKVHGKSLEGNLSGDSPDRDVSIYLPASYDRQKSRRYPVVYFLHGFTDSDDKWFGLTKHWINVAEVIGRAQSSGTAETIVVMPNAYTRFAGSMYSSSVTTGDWETFVARELVAFIDGRYRTLAKRESRGLAGHSMGGYGTLRIAMKNPDVFSSVYALNPCCLAAPSGPSPQGPGKAEAVRSDEEFQKADFFTKAQFASAAAWSPNPKNPPFFVDLPTSNGQWQPAVAARWAANAPLAMLDQYIPQLKRLQGIGIDAGDKEGSITATTRTLHELLDRNGIPHLFEIYDGNHTNRVAERIERNVLPFFSERLAVK